MRSTSCVARWSSLAFAWNETLHLDDLVQYLRHRDIGALVGDRLHDLRREDVQNLLMLCARSTMIPFQVSSLRKKKRRPPVRSTTTSSLSSVRFKYSVESPVRFVWHLLPRLGWLAVPVERGGAALQPVPLRRSAARGVDRELLQ